MNKVAVFVYGTLKKGFRAEKMLEGCEYLGKECIHGYSMYNYENKFPFISEDEGGVVGGELYLVPIDKLAYELDVYEGYNPYSVDNLYERKVVDLSVSGSGVNKMKCFTYVKSNNFDGLPVLEQVKNGEWNIKDGN